MKIGSCLDKELEIDDLRGNKSYESPHPRANVSNNLLLMQLNQLKKFNITLLKINISI
jgi:hypothetical protein